MTVGRPTPFIDPLDYQEGAARPSAKEVQVILSRSPAFRDLVRLLDDRLESARNAYELTQPASEFLRARVLEIRAFRKFVIEGDLE